LGIYAGDTVADTFFGNYIYQSQMPNYQDLLSNVGVSLAQNPDTSYFGASVTIKNDGHGFINSNPLKDSPSYNAKLMKGDAITQINGQPLPKNQKFTAYLQHFKVGDTIRLNFER
jgi:predicted metalloprotease with PDZ domain